MEPPPESLVPFLLSVFQPFSPDIFLWVLVLLLLLICSGLVSGSEVAFFSLTPSTKNDLASSNEPKDDAVLSLLGKPKRLLATILISNNFINVAIIILSSMITENLFDFSSFPLIGFIVQVVVVTFLILLFGEVIPKVYANQNALRLSYIMSAPLAILLKFFYPLSSILINATGIIDKRFKKRSDSISVDELSHALELTSEETADEEEKRILTGIVKFGNTDVKQIMTPRVDVFSFDLQEDFATIKELILEAGYSRIPVYNGSFDKIEGLLYVKDLLPFLGEEMNFKWQKLLRSPFFVPENKKIDDLLKEFQEKKIHVAIVVDEYGGSSGLISLEDIIEEIVGDISDEFDDDEITYSKLDESNYIFEGKTALKDFYRLVDIDGESFEANKGDSDSIAGFLIEIHGMIPKKGDQLEFKGFQFKIEAADSRKVSTVKVTLPESKETTNDEGQKDE